MAIKKYYAKFDNTITNAFEENLITRGTGSNMGASDILEVFSIYAQASTSSAEKQRVLISFDTTASVGSIQADRAATKIPSSGSVSFYLRMFNAEHGQTLPKSYTMDISAISGTWTEGTGMDMEGYKDKGISNWISASSTSAWSVQGGDYYTDSSSSFTASFEDGTEDIELDITPLVEQWLAGAKSDTGVGIFISSVYEDAARSYYTKKFFARGTEFFFKQPCIEARWDSSIEDDRGNFFYSSSLATSEENLNSIYLYNYFRGKLRDIPGIGTGSIYVSFFSGSSADTVPSASALELVVDGTHVTNIARNTVVTGSWVSTGLYKASAALTASSTPVATVYDVWHAGGLGGPVPDPTQFYTGSIKPITISPSRIAPADEYAISITNMKSSYRSVENARFRIYTRKKEWCPTIYTKAIATPLVHIVESGSYQIHRVIDELKVIPYGTGSDRHTLMSYDASGSYFDLDMSTLEPGYSYNISLSFYNDHIGDWVEHHDTFKFKIGLD
jgi:hypothetical protein